MSEEPTAYHFTDNLNNSCKIASRIMFNVITQNPAFIEYRRKRDEEWAALSWFGKRKKIFKRKINEAKYRTKMAWKCLCGEIPD